MKILIEEAKVQQVLEALERYQVKRQDFDRFADEITALREALAEQPAQQEPAGLLQEIARLHDRIKDLEKDVEFLSLPAQQEPVTAECNFVGTKEWGRCSIEHHNLVQSEPHKWPGYQTRLLYTSHQPAQQQEPVRIYDYVWPQREEHKDECIYACSYTPAQHLERGELLAVVHPSQLISTYLQREGETAKNPSTHPHQHSAHGLMCQTRKSKYFGFNVVLLCQGTCALPKPF
jgi:hypothetical protein